MHSFFNGKFWNEKIMFRWCLKQKKIKLISYLLNKNFKQNQKTNIIKGLTVKKLNQGNFIIK